MEKYEEMKVSELKVLAKDLGIEGADGMKKAELVEAISAFYLMTESDQTKASEPVEKPVESKPAKSRDQTSDLQNHLKFAKFKTTKGAV